MKKLSDQINLYTEQNGPGMIYAVLRDGSIMDMGFGGFANLETRTAITADSIFNIASNSKAFTAAALVLLMRNKQILSDDLLVKFVPEIPDYAKSIQIKDLVFHSSGLPHYVPLFNSATPVTNRNVIQFLHTLSNLEFPPGSKIVYCNTGYVLLAEALQRVSGLNFPDMMRKLIFDPLDMQNSRVISLEQNIASDKEVCAYDLWPAFELNHFSNADYIYGDGGFMVSMPDYIKWLRSLSAPGFFSKDELEKMFLPAMDRSGNVLDYHADAGSFSVDYLNYYVTQDYNQVTAGYGYGWIISSVRNEPVVCHGGSWCGYRSVVAYVPGQRLWIAMFSNYAGSSREQILAQLLKQYLS